MTTRVNEIEKDIYRISISFDEHRLDPASGFEFNHFLIKDKKSMLIHTGGKNLFEALKSAVSELIPLEDLSYLAFSHFESDECGALNNWLEAAPNAIPLVGEFGQDTVEDLSSKAPELVEDGQLLALGRRSILILETPHIPHNWDAMLFFETTSGILFSSDLGAHGGIRVPITEEDMTQTILEFQEEARFIPDGKDLIKVAKRLEQLDISYLATMHGSTLKGPYIKKLLQAWKGAEQQ
ncbi:MAG: hypothetical protein ACRC36_26980 [Lacrimispora sphenoides]